MNFLRACVFRFTHLGNYCRRGIFTPDTTKHGNGRQHQKPKTIKFTLELCEIWEPSHRLRLFDRIHFSDSKKKAKKFDATILYGKEQIKTAGNGCGGSSDLHFFLSRPQILFWFVAGDETTIQLLPTPTSLTLQPLRCKSRLKNCRHRLRKRQQK